MRVLLALLMVLIMENNIYAKDIEFTDITNSRYIDDINKLRELDIIVGVGENRFNPTDVVTAKEFAIMVVNSFYIDQLDYYNNNYLRLLIHYSTLPDSECRRLYKNDIDTELILKVLLDTQGINTDIYNTELNIGMVAKELGLIDSNIDIKSIPKREEVVHYISLIVNNKLNYNKGFKLINSKNTIYIENSVGDTESNKLKEEVIEKLEEIPEKLKYKFMQENWTIGIVNNLDDSVYGLCDANKRSLSIQNILDSNNGNTVFHEFGHSMHNILENYIVGYSFKSLLELIYLDEKEDAIELYREYTGTNDKECFADLFSYLLTNRDNKSKIELAREMCPSYTKLILDGIINSNKSLIDINIIDELYKKYNIN